jgi:hypothetical protein
MALINYNQSSDFCDTVEAFAVILQSCLVKLKDEADFRDDDDAAPLHAAHFLLQMLEDARETVSEASTRLEKRLIQHRS